ncbi:hypothetical protein DRW07_08415 [Alteromonas sediminis]|uniref:Lipoprotein n=1 Tax=Alteromonas sediminis TaxID=2259342 RepID=A0A3N5Y159_9ALTE|nr:hypothetical protein [Alteromonas sediminis]RPJ67527.1 hypothetical protein DRW07_08415 [Alteromonas sediminis]
MRSFYATLAISCSALTACSTTPPCEDILEVKRQEQECKRLSQVINNPKNPQQALTARQRFEAECENLRYYRDDYDTICKGSNTPIGNVETKRKDP